MPPEEPKHPAIECAKNGPYLIRNVETFTNSQSDAIQARRTMALCRCGASKNKPFCDGTHWYIDTVFEIVGHSNLGLADALRIQESEGRLRFFGV